MILPILQHPNLILDTVCHPVEAIDETIQQLVQDMEDTLADSQGIGLAAPQVGQSLRIFIVKTRQGMVTFINPEVELFGDEIQSEEGCLSFKDQPAMVPRRQGVKVAATDLDGEVFQLTADNFFAIVIQHENDHLHGKTIAPYRISSNEMAS